MAAHRVGVLQINGDASSSSFTSLLVVSRTCRNPGRFHVSFPLNNSQFLGIQLCSSSVKEYPKVRAIDSQSSASLGPSFGEAFGRGLSHIEHNQVVEAFFEEHEEVFEDKNPGFMDESGEDWATQIFAAGEVSSGSTVLLGPGTAGLVQQLRQLGVDVLVAHWSLQVLASVKEAHDEVVGARVVISHSQGKGNLTTYRRKYPHILLRDLPELEELQGMIASLPLEVVSFQNDLDLYLAVLKVTSSATRAETKSELGVSAAAGGISHLPGLAEPIYMRGKVVSGFGRGSKKWAFPQVRAPGVDGRAHKMVMNIGNRPTFADSEAITVEVHILYRYEGADFYGEEVAVIVLGYIRPEMKFKSLDELVERIHVDIRMAEEHLSEKSMHSFQSHTFFLS